MARSNKYTDRLNNAQFEQNNRLSPEEQAELVNFPGQGYYSRTSIEDVVNNFIVAYVGAGKMLSKVPRHEVAFWAQRGLQEFSYDILLSEKNKEFELGPSLSFGLPADYVNLVTLVAVDAYGNDRPILQSRRRTAKQALLQDENYDQLYDVSGDELVGGKSESTNRFQNDDATAGDRLRQDAYSLSGDDIYDYYYTGYFGRRYGLDPENENYNGEYQIDYEAGIIYFDSSFNAGDIIGLRYISDGLCDNDDLANVYVPKLAEDALYSFILYNLSKLRPSSAQMAPMFKKEMSAKMRNAKIRLSNYNLDALSQTLRIRSKWIKH